MYKCQRCNRQSKPREGQHTVVAESRQRLYENVIRRGRREYVVKSQGSEVVREIKVCAPCARAS